MSPAELLMSLTVAYRLSPKTFESTLGSLPQGTPWLPSKVLQPPGASPEPAPMSLLTTPMCTSAGPPGSACRISIIFGKALARAFCLTSMDGELSTMNRMSTSFKGLTRAVTEMTSPGRDSLGTVPPIPLPLHEHSRRGSKANGPATTRSTEQTHKQRTTHRMILPLATSTPTAAAESEQPRKPSTRPE
jgi:hypothetical protein